MGLTVASMVLRVVAVLVLSLALTAPAQAGGPSPKQPSTTKISRHEARQAASAALDMYLVDFLARPHTGTVKGCEGGPYLWRCAVTAHGADTACRATLAVWADDENYYMELRHLRCRRA